MICVMKLRHKIIARVKIWKDFFYILLKMLKNLKRHAYIFIY